MEVKIIKVKYFSLLIIFFVFISMNFVAANDSIDQNLTECNAPVEDVNDSFISISADVNLKDESSDLESQIRNSENGDEILIEPGTYKIHNIQITKNITLQGNGNPREVIIDGERKSSIFLIRSPDVYVTFKNITFINGLTHNFGGAISMETGNVYVEDCIFINNTALSDTNAGAISNYGTKKNKAYLFVNNTIFINNHADHDGGAVTTCYANSDMYNCVFINNSAHRDGGAIRVSLFGYGNVQDCIFMFNHADEWGGAYYSWSGESNIERCIFMNNTGGTNGGAVMVSGNINLEDSIITNNIGGETGGSFYIQQPMYDTKTVINVHNNLITNNTSPYGKEVFIKWEDSYNLYTQFNDNDWGDENPNDSSVIDPDNVTPRSKVSSTVKSNLFNKLNVDLLSNYEDLIKNYFPDNSLNDLKNQFNREDTSTNRTDSEINENGQNSGENVNDTNGNSAEDTEQNSNAYTSKQNTATQNINNKNTPTQSLNSQNSNTTSSDNILASNSTISNILDNIQPTEDFIAGNSSVGEDKKAYEINKTKSVAKQTNIDVKYFAIAIVAAFILLAIGYKRNLKEE